MYNKKKLRREFEDFKRMAEVVETEAGTRFLIEGIEKELVTLTKMPELRRQVTGIRTAICLIYGSMNAKDIIEPLEDLIAVM